MYNGKTEVTGDLYDITGRLAALDEDYFVLRDVRKGRFELHRRKARGGTYALTIPFDRLDARTLEYVRKTRAERADALFREIDEENRRLESKRDKAIIDGAAERVKACR
ncbi:MAG: hypothetical protein LBS99_04700 [Clostridiales bacterium]|jgi:hypothetical protein|nr:hypothetical protein [Clostridiales bacterium]